MKNYGPSALILSAAILSLSSGGIIAQQSSALQNPVQKRETKSTGDMSIPAGVPRP